jgi:hypothetical protein
VFSNAIDFAMNPGATFAEYIHNQLKLN